MKRVIKVAQKCQTCGDSLTGSSAPPVELGFKSPINPNGLSIKSIVGKDLHESRRISLDGILQICTGRAVLLQYYTVQDSGANSNGKILLICQGEKK